LKEEDHKHHIVQKIALAMQETIPVEGAVIELKDNSQDPYSYDIPVPNGTVARWKRDERFRLEYSLVLAGKAQARLLANGKTYMCLGCDKRATEFCFAPAVIKNVPQVCSSTFPTCGDKPCIVKGDQQAHHLMHLMGAEVKTSVHMCGFCQAMDSVGNQFSVCGKCRVTYYCSRECQAKHWKTGGHKKSCCPLPKSPLNQAL
jgi:hypothetical protein